MKLIHEVFNQPELKEKPPVLMDVGASGGVLNIWKDFAKYSICIAFDADSRELSNVKESTSGFKKLIVINRLVDDTSGDRKLFYLTKSPFCSSLLEPNHKNLQNWFNAPLFEIIKTIELPTVGLKESLSKAGVDYIDWFKSDSQGIDLRLLKSIDHLTNSILAIDLEPGIRGAYKKEEKLFDIMAFMDQKSFWISNLIVKGSPRINQRLLKKNFSEIEKSHFRHLLRISPGWGEISYLNNFSTEESFTKREFLLGWVFATVQKQYDFAMELAEKGFMIYDDPLFYKLEKHSLDQIKSQNFRIKSIAPMVKSVLKSTVKHLGII